MKPIQAAALYQVQAEPASSAGDLLAVGETLTPATTSAALDDPLALAAAEEQLLIDLYGQASPSYVNAFLFPQQALEVALYFQTAEGLSLSELDGCRALGAASFSGTGFSKLHK